MQNNNHIQEHQVTLSSVGIIKILAIALIVFLAYFLREVLGLLFVAIVISSALDPFVDRMQRFHIPRGVSIMSIYLFFIAAFFFIISVLVPPFIGQLGSLSTSLITYAPTVDGFYQYVTQNPDATIVNTLRENISSFGSSVNSVSTGIFATIQSFVQFGASLIFVFVITFYITIDEDGLKNFIRSLAPIKYQPYLVQKTNRIQERLGTWLSGQIALMIIMGLITFIGLSIFGVKYALVLAIVAGLFEFIPFVGPMISAVPAVFFAFTDSPFKALLVLIFYIVIQQLENHIIVPKVMQKALGMSPIVVLTAMLVGAHIAGIVGVLLAVPAATILWIFFEDFLAAKTAMDNSLE